MASPMYRQIAEDLRERIDSGQFQPGRQLPTELELRERYGASRNTVRDAIKWLMNLGLVETRPGQGTFVVRKIAPYVTTLTADPKGPGGDGVVIGSEEGNIYRSEVERQRRVPQASDPEVGIQKASGEVARLLRLPEGSQVISRNEKRFIDGTPWSMQSSFYPRGFALQGADLLLSADNIEEGTVHYLGATLGLKQVGYRDLITMRTPGDAEVDFFNLPPDGRVPVFVNFRTAFDQTGTPMRVTVTVFPADRNRFALEVGQVPEAEEQPTAESQDP